MGCHRPDGPPTLTILTLRTFSLHLSRAVGVALAVLLALLVVLAAVETAAWALFEISWAETSEISGVLLIWFGLLGAAYGIHTHAHLGVEVVTRRLPPRWRAILGRCAAVLVATFGGLLAAYGAGLTRSVHNTLPATGMSASVQYFPTVVCGILIVFFAAEEAIYGVDRKNREP